MLVYIKGGNIYEDWYAKFKGTETVFDVEFTKFPGRYCLKQDKQFTIYGGHATIIGDNIAVLEDRIKDHLTFYDKQVQERPSLQEATNGLLKKMQEAIDDFNFEMKGALIKQINVIPEYKGTEDGPSVVSLKQSELILNC